MKTASQKNTSEIQEGETPKDENLNSKPIGENNEKRF